MNSMMDQSPHSLHFSSSALRCAAIALLAAVAVVGQTRAFQSGSGNSNSARRNHIATIHAADSADGSRVSIVSDQSLSDYEAYRRGDRFYVKIPAADVPRAEAMRGRGFTDVNAQRSGDSTILSFRLQPGATSHVEQHGNRLEVEIAVPGGAQTTGAQTRAAQTKAATRSGDFVWSDTSGNPRAGGTIGNNRGAPGTRIGNAASSNANKRGNQSTGGNKNSSTRDKTLNGPANANSKSKGSNSNSATGLNKATNSNSSPGANKPGNANSAAGANKPGDANSSTAAKDGSASSAGANNSSNANSSAGSNAAGNASSSPGPFSNSAANSASPSPATNGSSTVGQPQTSPTPANSAQNQNAGSTATRSDWWSRAKERGHYWLLLAQLNPIPVAVGAAILILIIGLLFAQRRRAKATRRIKTVTKSRVQASEAASPKPVESSASVPAAAVTTTTPAPSASEELTETTRIASRAPAVAASSNGKPERVSRAADEANKIFAGQPYDEGVVGSDDRETRRMVGAELLSAMVSRNTDRRDRARAAFMKHGYFDDATRDLRVASSDKERAAAARRLSFTQNPEATPHLVAALSDPAPDVRRAAVQALMDVRDPPAIAPLNG